VCSNDLRIAPRELELGFLRGVQEQILVPDRVLYAVEKAFDLAHLVRLAARLGDRRLRVDPDPERGFRIDGELELALELRTARAPEDLRAARTGASGGPLRNMRVCVLSSLLRRARPSWRCVA
jgi:hypothetical protein